MNSLIISRSPLRISLGGGGTDLPSYYSEFEGFFVSAAIDKYVYVTVGRPFKDRILLKYSQFEECQTVDQIKHPIIRETLKLFGMDRPQIEISVFADIPAGTGLGSSGSFTTALIKALCTFYRQPISTLELAELACKIEIELLGEPVGKQDQYIASYGGISSFYIDKSGRVSVKALNIDRDDLNLFQENLMLFYTGISRSASELLSTQVQRSSEIKMQDNLHRVKDLGLRSRHALESGQFEMFAGLLSEQWILKRNRSENSSNSFIDRAYELAMESGALGGKLIGAGGGGFFMFYSIDKILLRKAMKSIGLRELPIQFDFQGTKVLT